MSVFEDRSMSCDLLNLWGIVIVQAPALLPFMKRLAKVRISYIFIDFLKRII